MDSEKHHLVDGSSSACSEPLMRSYKGVMEEEHLLCTEMNEDPTSSADNPCQSDRHCHEKEQTSWTESDERHVAKQKLFIACAVSLVFMIGEVIGGYAAHSLAIMTDAAHLLTDFGTIVMSIFSLWISSRPQTKTMTFGWHRAEILGVLLSVLSIWIVTGLLVFAAIQRIISGDYEIDSQIMLITSGCAVGVNILMALILHQSSASHGHSHGFPYSRLPGDAEDPGHRRSRGHGSASVRAAFIHVVGDLLQSVGVLLAATIIHFRPDFKIADPVCTFLFSVLVLGTTLTATKDLFRVLMEGTPQDIHFNTVRETLLSVRGVKATHNLHMWSLNMSHFLLSVHVAVEEDADAQMVLQKATKVLRSEFGFSGITIQVERYTEEMLHCSRCQDLTD